MDKILIVEDNKDSRFLLKKILEYLKYECDEAEDGLEAVEKVKEHEYILILMDIRMPNMDGLQAMEEIRKIEEQQGRKMSPIIALTAFSSSDIKKECEKFSIAKFIEKPHNLKHVKSSIEEVLRDHVEIQKIIDSL